MKITLNGEPVETDAPTLAALVENRGPTARVVATALNGNFVPAGARAQQPLAPGDTVEILAPMQGG